MIAANYIKPDQVINSSQYTYLLEKAVIEQLNAEEYFDYLALAHYYSNAFFFAKKNALEIAGLYFEQANSMALCIEQEVVDLWAKLYYLPKKSYYMFKRGELETAINLTQDAINVSIVLRGKGNDFTLFGEIQQYQNLSRIYFLTNKVEQAISICKECLILLYTGESTIAKSKIIAKEANDSKIDELIILLIYQIYSEALASIIKASRNSYELLCRCIKLFLFPELTNITAGLSEGYTKISECTEILICLINNKRDFIAEYNEFSKKPDLISNKLLNVLTHYHAYITAEISSYSK